MHLLPGNGASKEWEKWLEKLRGFIREGVAWSKLPKGPVQH